jgi:peptide chain release factor subunit 1
VAASVTWETLRQLAEFRAAHGCAISVYVDLDPSETPTARDTSTRVHSLLDGLRTSHGDWASLSHDQREALRGDVERIRRWFDTDFDRDGAHGVAVFCSGLDNLWRTLTLAESVEDAVSVGREALLTPLVPLVGRGTGAIVAVVSREEGRLYRLRAGRLEEVVDASDETPGQHDQGGWSQARYQRHIENLVLEHIKSVVGELGQQARRARSARVVIVIPQEMRSEFESALPGDVKEAVVGWAQAPAQAGPTELLEAVLPVLEQADAEDEAELVERWREEIGRDGRAAAGWAKTLEAASDARVEVLLFSQGVAHDAWQCPACGRLSVSGGQCPLDGTEMEHRERGLDLAVHHTLANGGQVRALRNRQDLDPVEGIGALLRF